ncbi:MAG: Alternative RNA polymerase sigma factor SigE, partial [uncultured Frankineae bacterium]
GGDRRDGRARRPRRDVTRGDPGARRQRGSGRRPAGRAGGGARHRVGTERGLDGSLVGRGRPHALRARLPAGLPPDRQPVRRRGPHPGGLRPRVPLAGQLHPRDLRGLAAPDHHQPVPRHGAPQGPHPLRRAPGRRRAPPQHRPGSGAGLRRHALRPRRAGRARRAPARLPGRRRPVRSRGPVVRGDRRDARHQDRDRPQPHPPGPVAAARRPGPPRPRGGGVV